MSTVTCVRGERISHYYDGFICQMLCHDSEITCPHLKIYEFNMSTLKVKAAVFFISGRNTPFSVISFFLFFKTSLNRVDNFNTNTNFGFIVCHDKNIDVIRTWRPEFILYLLWPSKKWWRRGDLMPPFWHGLNALVFFFQLSKPNKRDNFFHALPVKLRSWLFYWDINITVLDW